MYIPDSASEIIVVKNQSEQLNLPTSSANKPTCFRMSDHRAFVNVTGKNLTMNDWVEADLPARLVTECLHKGLPSLTTDDNVVIGITPLDAELIASFMLVIIIVVCPWLASVIQAILSKNFFDAWLYFMCPPYGWIHCLSLLLGN